MNANSDALRLLTSQVARLKSDHEGRLLHSGSLALEQFNPMRKATYDVTLKAAAQAATKELSAHAVLVREQVVLMTRQLMLPLTDETKAHLLAIAGQAFDAAIYPQRLESLVGSMARMGERMGVKVSEWPMQPGIGHASHHAGTANMIRRTLAVLGDELELLKLQSSLEADTPTHQSKIMTQNNTYNLAGQNARLYQNSVDNSINVSQTDPRVGQYIDDLRNALTVAELSANDKAAAMEVVYEVEAALQSGSPKKSVVTALLNSLPHVANVTTIVAGLVGIVGK
jgi:hypothetical protein